MVVSPKPSSVVQKNERVPVPPDGLMVIAPSLPSGHVIFVRLGVPGVIAVGCVMV